MSAKLSINEKARRDCVRHWQRMLKLSREDIVAGKEEPSGRNCAFCTLYVFSVLGNCIGCPIMDRTGVPGCKRTPYANAKNRYMHISYHGDKNLKAFRAAVRAEIKFLENLGVDQ